MTVYDSYWQVPEDRLSNPFIYTRSDGVTMAVGWRQRITALVYAPVNLPFEYTFDKDVRAAASPYRSMPALYRQMPMAGPVNRLLIYVPDAVPAAFPSSGEAPDACGWGLIPEADMESVFGPGSTNNTQNTEGLLQDDNLSIALLEGCRVRIERIDHAVNRRIAYQKAHHFAGMYRYISEGVYYPDMLMAPEFKGLEVSPFFPKRAIIPIIHYLNLQGYW